MLGTFTATLVLAGVTKSAQKGTVGISAVVRCFPKDGSAEGAFDRNWTGWLSPAAEERTYDSLEVMGYTFPDGKLDAITEGKGFTAGHKFQVEIEEQTYEVEENGAKVTKKSERVKWINPLGGQAQKNILAKDEAITVLAGLPGLEGGLASWREKRGMKVKPSAPSPAAEQANFAADDIPF